jgi:hypothetical protein
MAQQLATHQPCSTCGSSDALTIYEWGSKCYSCGETKVNKQTNERNFTVVQSALVKPTELRFSSITERGISRDTCLAYGVGD